VLAPVACQEVIVEQVEQDTGITAESRGEARPATLHQRVVVDEAVDAPMQRDRGQHIRRVAPGRKAPLDEIAEVVHDETVAGSIAVPGMAILGRMTMPEEPIDYQVTVAEVMRESFLMVDGMNTIHDVMLILRSSTARCLVVYKRHEADEYGMLLVSDIGRKVLATGRRPERINVYEVMAKPAITVPASMGIADCARLLTRGAISHAPVVDAAEQSADAETAPVTAQEQQQERPQQHADD
jgi:predicted transcriptional regulator